MKKPSLEVPPPAMVGIQTSRFVNQSPIFYGWVIMMAGTIGLIMTSPGQTYAVSIFIDHFIEDLHISRSLVSTLYTVGTLTGSLALPVIGRQIDRRGARLVVIPVTILFGLACIYMGFVYNALMLGLGFIAIRMLGQGSLTLVSTNVINQWWVRRRGMVMGITGVLMGLLGLGGFPSLINWLIPIYGWRSTYMLLGLSLLLVMLPFGSLFFRDRPEAYGLEPDGYPSPTGSNASATKLAEVNWTLPETMQTPVFWLVAASSGTIAMLTTGLFFHMVSIFKDNGLGPTAAAATFVPIAVTAAVVNLGSGVLVDRVPARFLLIVALVLQSISLWLALYMPSVELAFVYGVILGTLLGLSRMVNSVIWAQYFGRQHLGSITGVTTTIMVAGSALGPMPFGIARDMLNSYYLVLTVSAVIPLILAAANLFFSKPERQVSEL